MHTVGVPDELDKTGLLKTHSHADEEELFLQFYLLFIQIHVGFTNLMFSVSGKNRHINKYLFRVTVSKL